MLPAVLALSERDDAPGRDPLGGGGRPAAVAAAPPPASGGVSSGEVPADPPGPRDPDAPGGDSASEKPEAGRIAPTCWAGWIPTAAAGFRRRGRSDREAASSRHRPSMVTLSSAPAVDTRRYRWMIGIIGLDPDRHLSIYQFATHGLGHDRGAPGPAPALLRRAAGQHHPDRRSANLTPPCTPAQHDPRALNICLLARRGPLVLAFFVDRLGRVRAPGRRAPAALAPLRASGVQFAAVAVNASRSSTGAAIRSHHWTIPVAYDDGGGVGGLYGVAVCPMAELAIRGGIVQRPSDRGRWADGQALAAARPGSGAHRRAGAASDRRAPLSPAEGFVAGRRSVTSSPACGCTG